MKRRSDSSGPRAVFRPLLIPLTVLLLVSLACSLPQIGGNPIPAATSTSAAPVQGQPPVQASGTPQQAAAAQLSPTAQPKLPPALVEVDPLPRSEIGPGDAPVFYFNQPMERGSVEASFKVQPEQSGRFEWLNDSAVRYVPARPVTDTGDLKLTINAGAKAANGLALAQPVEVSYPAAGPLRLAERLPAPDAVDVNPSSAVVVTFNRPVVTLGADAQNLPNAFTLDPAVAGRGEWLNTSTYIFYPEPALLGGAQYVVRLNSGLVSADGSPLAADASLEWSFSTSAPKLLTVKPSTEQPIPLDAVFTLTFNQPMDTASVQSDFSLLASGGPVEGVFTWNDTASEVTFKPNALLQRDADYTLALFGTARSQGGTAIGQDFAATIATAAAFAVVETRPAANEVFTTYSGYGSLELVFNAPVATGQDLNQLITLKPPIQDQRTSRDALSNKLYITGYFQPSTNYTLTVSADLRDRWGAVLGMPFAFPFKSQAAEPELSVPIRQIGARALFIPQNETSLQGYATNINRLVIGRGRLNVSEFIQANGSEQQAMPDWQSKIQTSWPVLLYPTLNVSEPINIPLSQDNNLLTPGLYLFKLDPQPMPRGGNFETPALLVVSQTQMIFKTSNRQAFIWAVKMADNTPIAGAEMTVYDQGAAPLGTCTTDAEGRCQVDLPEHAEPYEALYAVHGQPGDADFSLAASNWTNGLSTWEYGFQYEQESSRPEVYLYTDRPIYRPGQMVNFRSVVRARDNGRYAASPLQQITLDVVSPYNPASGASQVLTSLRMPLDALGSASAGYSLPEDAAPGTYTLRVQDVPFKEITFEVAEYRKPEIDLQVQFKEPDVLAGKDLSAQVNANYFFGAPAGNLKLKWTLYYTPAMPKLPAGMQAGRLDTSWLLPWEMLGKGGERYAMDGEAQTDPSGAALITISGQQLKEKLESVLADPQEFKLEVTAEDESGLPVSARANARMHPALFYACVKPEQYSVQTGQEITYSIRSVDWAGNPVADKPLTARFRKVAWVEQENANPTALPTYTPQYTEIGSTDFHTSASGDARLAFIPAEPGTFMLEVSGEDGAVTQVLTWVGGSGSALWPKLPNQRVLLQADAEKYKPGDTAHIFIPNPFPEGAQVLVTVERAKVMRSSVVQIKDASYDLALPLSAEDAPNVYVTVTLLGRTSGRLDFRVGYVELMVDRSAQELQVEVQASPEQPQPGGDVTINIRARDQEGKPAQGEFSLALVDKAIYALADPNTPNIIEAFYGEQPLGVRSALSLAIYSGRLVATAPGRGGGGGAADEVTPTVRTKFADTAYWNGAIQTDVTGVAQVTLKLPDNLTTWRADVRGLTQDTRVGQAQAEFVVSKPVLIRPVTPRFVVLGDHLQLAAVVHNNTQQDQQAGVRLEGSGFTLDDANQAVQVVAIKAGERKQVSWWGTVQDVDGLDLTFGVEAGQYRDAAQPELSPIPVIHYSAPQTFGTAGVLEDASQRTELVSLPRSFTPAGGKFSVELLPSLSSAVLDGLKALETYPHDFTEPILSTLLPNLATLQALQELKLEDPALRSSLQQAVNDSATRLVSMQNEEGGWGWTSGWTSGRATDPYITSYVLFGLSWAAQAGAPVDAQVLQRAQDALAALPMEPSTDTAGWQMDRYAFQHLALQQSGRGGLSVESLYTFRDKLSPWGKACLALVLQAQQAGDPRVRTLVSDLESTATRSATGANWSDPGPTAYNWSTPGFTTAVVTYALARLDPASQVLTDAARYILLNRRADGGWLSSYETAWSLLALVETAKAQGAAAGGAQGAGANYAYSAQLNGAPLLEGKVDDANPATKPVNSVLPLNKLSADAPNTLTIQHGAGTGRLYYRAFLEVGRPAKDAPAVERGLSITREYTLAGQDCRKNACPPMDTFDLSGSAQTILVHLTLTVPQDMQYVVVEDNIPAGAEVLNTRLKSTQQNVAPDGSQAGETPTTPYDLANPFAQGWGWWLFSDPQVYDNHVRWVVDSLPAGTYELTYRLAPYLAGEYQVIPAHAWQYYFPDVEGSSQGSVLKIK